MPCIKIHKLLSAEVSCNKHFELRSLDLKLCRFDDQDAIPTPACPFKYVMFKQKSLYSLLNTGFFLEREFLSTEETERMSSAIFQQETDDNKQSSDTKKAYPHYSVIKSPAKNMTDSGNNRSDND